MGTAVQQQVVGVGVAAEPGLGLEQGDVGKGLAGIGCRYSRDAAADHGYAHCLPSSSTAWGGVLNVRTKFSFSSSLRPSQPRSSCHQ